METADKKLINIFLVGQPELNDKLSQSKCRPLLQRIGIRYHIEPLDIDGTREYMATRLKVAGADDVNSIFSKNVIKAIYQYSEGYPRMINVLADNALLLGYSTGKRKITPVMIKECFQDMRPAEGLPKTRQEKIESAELEQNATAPSGRYWKWAAVLLFAMVAALVINVKGQDIIGRLTSLIPIRFEEGVGKLEKNVSNQVISAKERSIGNGQEGTQRVMDVAVKSGVGVRQESEEKVDEKNDQGNAFTIPPVEAQGNLDGIDRDKEQALWTTIIAKEGNTVTELATKVYGWANQGVIDLLGKNNPGIGNVNWIHEGQRIFFPPLAASEQESTYTVQIASFKSFAYAQEMFHELTREQHDAYIIPAYDSQKGKIFRVTLGDFKDLQKARDYASKIKEMGPMASQR
jgi:phage tail protein X